MITVLDPAAAEQRLVSGGLGCGGCGERLAPWGHASPRAVRTSPSGLVWVRCRRARCTGCGHTHVLLPARCLPRRLDTAETVGAALLAASTGAGHRAVAASLQRPVDTVRGWLRRIRAQAGPLWMRALRFAAQADAEFDVAPPRGTPLGDLVEALGQAASAATRRLGPLGPPWQVLAHLTDGLGLGPAPDSS